MSKLYTHIKALVLCSGIAIISHSLFAQDGTVDLAPMEVIADRAFETNLGLSTDTLLGESEATLSIDQALRRLSSVDTFRSIDSFTAHPTTQGVRFRHTATNATSRSLLLVNGIPQNDPFGGWIYWNKLPIESLASMSVYGIGSVPAWGNYSSGGAIHLTTRSPFDERSRISLTGGSFGTVNAAFDHASKISEQTAVSVEGRFFTTDGYNVVRSDQRGSVDRASESDYDYLRAQLTQVLNEDWQWTLTGQYFDEERINGTPQSPNSTYATDLSWALEKNPGNGPGFNFVSFYQDRGFKNVFTSVSADRTTERPVLDQYSVPAEAFGAQATLLWEGNGYLNYLAGADFRHAEGSANEFTRNLGAGFTRERQEGGEQSFTGAFFTVQSLPDENSTLEGTVRADHWSQQDGFRREFNLETDTQTRDTAYPNRSGDVISLNSRYTRRLDANWSFEALVFHGFRAPTLNELYRPFRVRNDITESNPDLNEETSTGGELSLYYLDESNSFELSVFHYELDDMVTNLFLSDAVGFDPLCGFVPGGGSCNQRGNVENSQVQGFEVAWLWDSGNDLEFLLNYTFGDTEFKRSLIQPSLDGKAFPLSPRHKITSQLMWNSSESLDLFAQVQYRSNHYDNPLNTRKIDSSVVVNVGAHYQRPDEPWSVRVQIDNLFDEDVTTAISSSGVFTQAAPLNAWVSISYER